MSKTNPQGTNKATGKARAASVAAGSAPVSTTKPKARTPRPKSAVNPQVEEMQATPVTAEPASQNTPTQPPMEVHHHPDIAHGKKSFKQYLLEGLMIFVAVMMGFIAENIREAITNHEHVKELTSQLVQDIKTDTLQLNKIYSEEAEISKANDSLFNLLQKPVKPGDARMLQRLIIASHSIWPFHQSTGAIDAIKKELHLKQFSDSKIISYISEYEKHTELLHTVEVITLQYQRSFIDPFLLKHFTALSLDNAFNKRPVSEPILRSLPQEDATQLNVDMALIKINTKELLMDNRLVRDDAVALLKYVKEKYNPADE